MERMMTTNTDNGHGPIDWDDIDDAQYIGDEQDGCYVRLGEGRDADGKAAFYVTVTVDSAHFVADIVTADGPYATELAAREAGVGAAKDWCCENEVAYDGMDIYAWCQMGWTFTRGATRNDVIEEITATTGNDERTFRTVKRKVVREYDELVLWAVHESVPHRGKSTRFIGCHLLREDPSFGWGYKSMDESMGPNYVSCPVSYLGLAPTACAWWRNLVRAHGKVTASA